MNGKYNRMMRRRLLRRCGARHHTSGFAKYGRRPKANIEYNSKCKPCAVTAPAIEAQHFPSPLLGKLGVLVHASAAHLL